MGCPHQLGIAYERQWCPDPDCEFWHGRDRFTGKRIHYSAVTDIGYTRSLEERSDEGWIVLDVDEIGLDAVLEQLA